MARRRVADTPRPWTCGLSARKWAERRAAERLEAEQGGDSSGGGGDLPRGRGITRYGKAAERRGHADRREDVSCSIANRRRDAA